MSADELLEKIHQQIQSAVQRAGGNWKQAFEAEALEIMKLLKDASNERR
jgi:hypothetical protein